MTVIDMWTGPTPTPQQFPRSYTRDDGIRQLLDKIKGIETQLREVTSNLLRTAGIYLSPSGMTIDKNLAVTGTLSLPAGIIDNAALTSPVTPGFAGASATNFAVPVAGAIVCSTGILVPAGYTRAVVHVTVNATCANSTAVTDYLYVYAVAVAGHGGEAFAQASAGGRATASASAGQLVTGLVGGTNLDVQCHVRSAFAGWAANAANIANVDATCLFLR